MIEANFEEVLEADEPIELHAAPTPDGFKVAIMLAELSIPHVAIIVSETEAQAPKLLKAHVPANTLPVIVDPEGPDGNQLVIFESGAILRYLARKHAGLYPTNERKKAEVDQWLFWSEATLRSIACESLRLSVMTEKPDNRAAERLGGMLQELLKALDGRLEGRDFIAGDYSIADVSAFPWVRKVAEFAQDFNKFRNIASWLERISSRTEVKRGLAIGRGATRQATANASPAGVSDQSSGRLPCDTP